MPEIKPFGIRLTVIDPPTERQRPSGLIIVSTTMEVAVGIVINNPFLAIVHDDMDRYIYANNPQGAVAEQSEQALTPGTLVYYAKDEAIRIRDVVVVHFKSILAYED